MKKILTLILSVILMLSICGCSQSDLQGSNEQVSTAPVAEIQESSATGTPSENQPESTELPTKRSIIMTIDENQAVVVLNDSVAADSFYELLPLTVSFEDFNNTEKIAYLNDELNISEEPDSFDPDVGDFCLYAPWGNISIFYKDFRNSDSLISLGTVESGLEYIEAMSDDTTVVLEKN